MSRLVDTNLGLTAVIQPRPVSLFESASIAPIIPAMDMETVQETNSPSLPTNDELEAETEMVRLPQTPLPTPQETTLPPKTAAIELARPQSAKIQQPAPADSQLPVLSPLIVEKVPIQKPDPPNDELDAEAELVHLPPPLPTPQETTLPPKTAAMELARPQSAKIQQPAPADSQLPILSPLIVEKVSIQKPDPPSEDVAQTEPSIPIKGTAVSPIIQRIVSTSSSPALENRMMTPIPIKQIEQSERHPRELSTPPSIALPTIQPVLPLAESPADAVAPQLAQPSYRYDKPESPERIMPEITITPPPATTAVIQPAITLYQEPKRPFAVPSDPTPTVEIRIGRIEVRAAPPSAPPVQKQPVAPLMMSLEDYLRQRKNGGIS